MHKYVIAKEKEIKHWRKLQTHINFKDKKIFSNTFWLSKQCRGCSIEKLKTLQCEFLSNTSALNASMTIYWQKKRIMSWINKTKTIELNCFAKICFKWCTTSVEPRSFKIPEWHPQNGFYIPIEIFDWKFMTTEIHYCEEFFNIQIMRLFSQKTEKRRECFYSSLLFG